jgi:tRNA pseudouridine55 synthase
MEKNSSLHLLYKNLGETPLECIERFKKDYPEYTDVSITYAGRLDPMAEGLVLALSGEAISEKQKYLDLPKTYRAQILWGLETDSLDILGLVSGESDIVPSESQVEEKIEYSTGVFSQEYPLYSSKNISKRPISFGQNLEGGILPQWKPEVSSHEVELLSAHYISREEILGRALLETIISRINLVWGDFRQQETKEEWGKILDPEKKYIIDTVDLLVSRGFYVRQFISDISHDFGTIATTFHIKREKIGDFSVEK